MEVPSFSGKHLKTSEEYIHPKLGHETNHDFRIFPVRSFEPFEVDPVDHGIHRFQDRPWHPGVAQRGLAETEGQRDKETEGRREARKKDKKERQERQEREFNNFIVAAYSIVACLGIHWDHGPTYTFTYTACFHIVTPKKQRSCKTLLIYHCTITSGGLLECMDLYSSVLKYLSQSENPQPPARAS